jgi:outer membrane protein TolC
MAMMKKKTHLIPLVLAFVLVTVTTCPAGGDFATLASYLEQALQANDDLRAAQAEFRAGTERVRQAGVLPDPKLSVQYYLQPVETRTGPQNGAIGISQAIPWFGKLSLLRELSDREAAIAGIRLAAVELDVARQVKEAYIEYGYLGRSKQTVSDNIELLRYLEGVARSQYAGGKSTYFDVLKIQIELARSEEKEKAIVDQAGPLRIHINSLLGSEPERARAIPTTLPQVVLDRGEDEIISVALENAPILREAQERIARARIGKELAEKDFYPDFTFSLKTIFTGSAEFGDSPDSGDDPVIAGLTMNLPVFRDRRHGKVAEKEALISSANSFRRQQVRNLATDIERSLYAYRKAQRRVALYQDDLLPKVNQQLEVAINGFQSGQLTILEVIDAEQNLLNFQLAENRAVADRALAVARLEASVGLTLADWVN